MRITERQRTVLEALAGQERRWLRPMDFGGRDGSHHSATAAALLRKGLVERRTRHGLGGSYVYRITDQGECVRTQSTDQECV